MEPCYLLQIHESQEPQREEDLSFIGGKPRIPADVEIPTCRLCGADLTFYFQVAFPEGHTWEGLTMALFACTSCARRGYGAPRMLDVNQYGPYKGIDIPEHFLEEYQNNFRILLFKTEEGRMRRDYKEKTAFKRWNQVKCSRPNVKGNKIGGRPRWLIEDETPGTYNKTIPMIFLMQIMEDITFEKLPEAPPQIKINLYGEQEPSKTPFYRLFLANQLYFFGTEDRNNPLVYIITQRS